MKAFALFATIAGSYTAWCAAYGPPYNDAYGKLVHSAWLMFVG